MERQLAQLQREARRRKQDERLCGLTPRAQLVCLAIYILSGFDLEVAAAFVYDARKNRKRGLAAEILEADVPSQIRAWFLECSLERLYQLQIPRPDCLQDQSVHEEAIKYISKFCTAAWVADQNYKHGLAPTYDALVQKYHSELGKRECGHIGDRILHSADGQAGFAGRTARAWCNRFCKQFGLARKRLNAGSEVPPAELEEKAGKLFSLGNVFCNKFQSLGWIGPPFLIPLIQFASFYVLAWGSI